LWEKSRPWLYHGRSLISCNNIIKPLRQTKAINLVFDSKDLVRILLTERKMRNIKVPWKLKNSTNLKIQAAFLDFQTHEIFPECLSNKS